MGAIKQMKIAINLYQKQLYKLPTKAVWSFVIYFTSDFCFTLETWRAKRVYQFIASIFDLRVETSFQKFVLSIPLRNFEFIVINILLCIICIIYWRI